MTTPILSLLRKRRPAAILWFVIAVGAYAVERVPDRSRSHVPQECLEVAPFSADGNASPTVPRVRVVAVVVAPSDHRSPRVVLGPAPDFPTRRRDSSPEMGWLLLVHSRDALATVATATLRGAIHDLVRAEHANGAAVALALPRHAPVHPHRAKQHQTAESVANLVIHTGILPLGSRHHTAERPQLPNKSAMGSPDHTGTETT